MGSSACVSSIRLTALQCPPSRPRYALLDGPGCAPQAPGRCEARCLRNITMAALTTSLLVDHYRLTFARPRPQTCNEPVSTRAVRLKRHISDEALWPQGTLPARRRCRRGRGISCGVIGTALISLNLLVTQVKRAQW